jgi:hypothetical protein
VARFAVSRALEFTEITVSQEERRNEDERRPFDISMKALRRPKAGLIETSNGF